VRPAPRPLRYRRCLDLGGGGYTGGPTLINITGGATAATGTATINPGTVMTAGQTRELATTFTYCYQIDSSAALSPPRPSVKSIIRH